MDVRQDGGKGDQLRAPLFDQPYILCTLTMLFWASNALIGRAMAGHVPPVALAQMRWTLAFLILLPFAYGHIRRDWPVLRARWRLLTALGFVGISLYNTFLYIGLTTTGAINAAMLTSVFPVLVAVMGFAIYRDRLTRLQVLGILVSSFGAAIILTRGNILVLREVTFVIGDLWVLGSQVAYACYAILLRKRPPVHPLTFAAVTIFIGQLVLVPFALVEGIGGQRVTFDWPTIATVLYVAVFPAVLAYIFFNRAVELIGSNRTAPFFHLVPVFTSIGAVALLGERVAPYHLLGAVLIIVGIAATQFFRADRVRSQSPMKEADSQSTPR